MAPEATRATVQLPTSIVSPTDIARLSREIESIDSFFQEQQIRSAGASTAMPRLSKLMDQLASDNQLNLLTPQHRQILRQLLEQLHRSAPVMHISFSVDPPGAYVQKIIEWLRQNIHQHVLVTVGLQPNIGAGCIVRTTNRMFDFSLREFFSQKRPFFIEKLHQAITNGEEMAMQVETVTPTEQSAPIHAEESVQVTVTQSEVDQVAGVVVAPPTGEQEPVS